MLSPNPEPIDVESDWGPPDKIVRKWSFMLFGISWPVLAIRKTASEPDFVSEIEIATVLDIVFDGVIQKVQQGSSEVRFVRPDYNVR